MSKPLLLFRGPIKSISGYGAHSRDILKSLYELDLFDIKIDSCVWGLTPLTALKDKTPFSDWVNKNIITTLNRQPDIYIQVTIPNEFMKIGKVNIGITAGIETTVAPKDWIDGCNRMDLIITTSNFSKNVLINTVYNETDKITNKVVKIIKVEKPIEVLFEGVVTETFNKKIANTSIIEKINSIPSDFCFLFVGHWLNGVLGQDRKDVGMLIKCFTETFKGIETPPALVLKTSAATFSIKERERFRKNILDIVAETKDAPPVYLLFGELLENELNDLYNHPKIKAMVTLTKGEGFGRPLLEFTMSGKPVLASNWSGHLDFLPSDKSILLSGALTPVHDSAVDKFIIKDSKWFTVDYEYFSQVMKYFTKNYETFLERSEKLKYENENKFSYDMMKITLKKILDIHIKIQNKNQYELIIPELIK